MFRRVRWLTTDTATNLPHGLRRPSPTVRVDTAAQQHDTKETDMALKHGHKIAASWAGVAAALVATGTLATAVVAAGPGNGSGSEQAPTTTVAVDDAYVACMR